MLTEGAVRSSDKRAQFIGVDAYEAAGGRVLRDLFQGHEGGWLQDVALVDQMVAEKLKAESEMIAAEGWKWIPHRERRRSPVALPGAALHERPPSVGLRYK